ncbi:hypothetical protein BDDG_12557 [Blastomyces dermatitidis ATCC 18188]|uniref:Uncharacterized protein n=1 Tax=Ajellomyces dermatitidis (strain ATCC 18188 / CBS 674.68) TaxID=653446 RepID=A0A0J9EPY2_AJEDA|nr:hypothetical protein BDDG_12557 [Blastomyces dermatitidis ATCC 18188]
MAICLTFGTQDISIRSARSYTRKGPKERKTENCEKMSSTVLTYSPRIYVPPEGMRKWRWDDEAEIGPRIAPQDGKC